MPPEIYQWDVPVPSMPLKEQYEQYSDAIEGLSRETQALDLSLTIRRKRVKEIIKENERRLKALQNLREKIRYVMENGTY